MTLLAASETGPGAGTASADNLTVPVRPEHRLDEAALDRFLSAALPEYAGELEVSQFPGGYSNPTYCLSAATRDGGRRDYALRKKPGGKLLPSAHQVGREFQVLSALKGSGLPVPPTRAFLDDGNDVLGQAFFIMDRVEGRIFHDPTLPGIGREERAAIYDSMNDVLARLHEVDIAAVGLDRFRRNERYVLRQIDLWTRQYEAARTEDVPEMERLIEWLPRHVPPETRETIAHGDYRPGNLIIHPSEPRVVAVLDWELWTVGDPLADLSYACLAYYIDELPTGFAGKDYRSLGIPTEAEFVERYCRRTGRHALEHWTFYLVLNLFKAAAIAQGVYKRALDGTSAKPGGLERRRSVKARAATAWELASGRKGRAAP